MESRSVFRNLSPLDHRYYSANREAFSALADHLSEEAAVRYCTRVEAALLRSHLAERFPDRRDLFDAVDRLETLVTPEDVYAEEEKTNHNIRALVRVIKRHLPEDAAALVHVGATSVDILDTANALRTRAAVREVVLPGLLHLANLVIQLCDDHADTPQVARTHGQHGVPITFGFAMAEYASRLGKSIEEILIRADQLRGKLAGAVGAYNSLSIVTEHPEQFERDTLSTLGLLPSDHSTQMVEPEYLLRLLLEINVAFGIVANLADDLRHLQRTEIDEIREMFGSEQVGSSTMPQKRNPWNSEHVKSLWKAFAPRVSTFFMDQISEHQRDLTNSASGRFTVDYIAGFVAAVQRMIKVVQTIRIDEKRMRANLAMTGDMVLSEAVYSLLATCGVADAHEELRKATLEAERRAVPLVSVLDRGSSLWSELVQATKRFGMTPEEFLSDPTNYAGRAASEARRIAEEFATRMSAVKEALER
jgi:adenylosuccinate lyase